MILFFISKTYEPINHGPAKFANYLREFCGNRDKYQLYLFAEDVINIKHPSIKRIETGYSRFLRPFSEILRNFTYYERITEYLTPNEEKKDRFIVFNNSIHSLYTSNKRHLKIPIISFINDNENIRTGWSNFHLNKKWLFRMVMRSIEKRAAKNCSKVIVCSNTLKKQVASHYNIPISKIYTLYQGIDLSRFTFQQSQTVLAKKKFIKIAFIKSDYQRGGLKILKSAIKQLPHLTFHLSIAGPWPSEKRKIEKEFHQVSNCKISFLGQIMESAVISLLHSHDIFCVPSLREALGVANIEALACGTPVVTSSSLGIPEVLDNGNNGWMSKPGDSSALAQQLQLCIDSDSVRKQKVMNGRRFVEKHFDIYKNIEQFLDMLESDAGNFFADKV